MAKININSLELNTIIGVLPFERQIRQTLLLDVSIVLDIMSAGLTDDLKQTIDYTHLARQLQETAKTSSCQLIEALIVRLKETIMEGYPQILGGKLILHKRGALQKAHAVSVEIEW